LLVLVSGIWVFFLPGLRQEAAEWKRAVQMLYAAPKVSTIKAGQRLSSSDLDALIGLVPILTHLDGKERETLLQTAEFIEAPSGTTILSHGEIGDDAFFILSGRAIAGVATPDGGYRSLSSMTIGDFFGEIAALTGSARTADVVAEQSTRLLKVPASTLRIWMQNPAVSGLFLSTIGERLNRTSIKELPRFAGVDQSALRELRSIEITGVS
jgi:CRP-like cAMP-binding protein